MKTSKRLLLLTLIALLASCNSQGARDKQTCALYNADKIDAVEALERLGLQDFVKSLPKGFDSEIQPYGSKLPRSIIQKLIIARAIADKPKILLFEL